MAFPNGNPAAGQTVRGQLLDQATKAPVEGALALLLNAEGEEINGVLTNAQGRFLLRAPGPGSYTVRTDRIGYGSVTSEPLSLEARQIFGLRLEAAETAIQLEGIRVEGEQRCVVRPEEGLEVARVWEEARKALTVQEWTDREGMYRFRVVAYERDLDPGARRVRSETRRVTTGVARSPIRSLPAEDLMENGFIRHLEDGGLEYFGPDALVLLSDVFLDSHCFRLTTHHENQNMVGLAFEPVRRTAFRDVAGTLWLDRETAALQSLDYGYNWAQYPEAIGVARGHVEFEGLPNGSWIVRKWWIRMPQLDQDLNMATGGRSGIYVSGVREAGGEISRVDEIGARRIAQDERGTVSGVVWDSLRHAPLEGALVYLSGTSFSGTTDAEGRFLISGVSEGVFTAVFTHPRLDTLGVRATGVDVEVDLGEVTELHLGVPSSMTMVQEACEGEKREWGSAVVTGVVREGSTLEPIPEATVRLEWQEVVSAGSGRISAQQVWFEIPTDSRGRYTVCRVPAGELIVVQATFMERRSDTVQISVRENSYNVIDLEIIVP